MKYIVLSLLLFVVMGVLEFSTSSAATINERSDLIEGDIYIGDKNTRTILRSLSHHRLARNALLNPLHLWPKARVPYMFATGVSEKTKRAVKMAISDLEKYTCVRFVPKSNERDYVYIISKGNACYSAIGRSRGQQKLSLGSGCDVKGIVIHELMHTIGFFHEQSRRDRDDFVTIHWSNIDSKQHRNFQKYAHGVADVRDEPYDYTSLMHYNKYAFSTNRRPTIVPKKSGVSIGQRVRLSSIDIKKINKLYKCGAKSTTEAVPATTTKTESTTMESTTVESTVLDPTTKENTPIIKERCANRHSFCPLYALFGYCRHRSIDHRRFMYNYCKYTCGYCKRG